MKKFIVDLVSNRFGIILAAFNLCYFASQGFDLLRHWPGKIFACLNAPAAISTVVTIWIAKIFQHEITPVAVGYLIAGLFSFFVVLQWLFIAWLAKTLAAKLRKINLK